MSPSKWLTISQWQSASERPADAAEEILRRIRRLPRRQQAAVWAWLPDEARLSAAFARGGQSKSPLAGIPYALKDLFSLVGTRTRAGSAIPDRLAPVATADANLVRRLVTLGAVCAGKTHLHEFAYGLTGENETYGDVTIPGSRSRTSGGSSSGSAIAVATGIVPLAIGTDTGGSMRVPAAFCGLHAVRLTPGHPFIADAFPLSPSFDTPGWFARTAEDLELATVALLGAMAPRSGKLSGLSLSFSSLCLTATEEVRTGTTRAARKVAAEADTTTAESYRSVAEGSAEAYAILNSVEAFRFHEHWLQLRPTFYSKAVRQRIERGKTWSPAEISAAEAKRDAVRAWFSDFFRHHDFLLLPATPFPALTKAQCTLSNRQRLLTLLTPGSLAGIPIRTLPVRLPSGLHSGLQMLVKDEATLLRSFRTA